MAQPKRSSDHRSSRGGRQKTPARKRPAAAASQDPVIEEITLHGHRVSFRRAGWGPAIRLPPARGAPVAGDWSGGLLGGVGGRASSDVDELGRGLTSLHDAGAGRAFVYTLRSIVEGGGQRVGGRDRLYLAKEMPT